MQFFFYALNNLPIEVEQKGTNSQEISPVSTAAGMLTSHESQKFWQYEHDISSPISFGALAWHHSAKLGPMSSPRRKKTPGFFSKITTNDVTHPVTAAAAKYSMMVMAGYFAN
jgi:hypothetical protein